MSVGVLIIAHHPLGEAVLHTAIETVEGAPLAIDVLSVTRNSDPELLIDQARTMAERLDSGDGLLVLTDIFGSTPSNIACTLHKLSEVNIIAGLNLPMVIRIFNYPNLNLEKMTENALSGGSRGIFRCRDRH